MAVTVFKDTTYSLSTLVEEIKRGEIALPDIQRPFVWKASKVRDLFDSMYKGFPVGYLLFWATGAEVGARKIGIDSKEAAPRLMIVDGQQRLTSLYAVLTGDPVLTSDFKETQLKIAFRPKDSVFEVADAAIKKNPEFLPDISVLWGPGGRRTAEREFLRRLAEARGEIDAELSDELQEALDRVYDIRNYPFKVVELGADVDEEDVAEVFVRINSEGVRLQQADFILTLMSVWWEKGRKELEEFARAAKVPSRGVASPANPFIDPSPDQLLRVTAGLAFSRGALRHVYRILRGKDPDTEEVSPELRERQFARLREAQEAVLDLTNWHEYLKAIQLAGFRSRSMITSENNVLFGYLMYLIGRRDHGLDRRQLRDIIARWFFMTALTGRYTGSFESQVEQDLRRVAEASNADEFVSILDGIIETTLTNDYWEIQLPSALDSSAAYSPGLFAYHASLVLLGATPLFSRLTVNELLDPATHAPRSAIERHHLFPKAYLSKIGVERTQQRNQIANYAFVEWPDNATIADNAPADYFPPLWSELTPTEQANARFWHALPEQWEHMSYFEFLEARRNLIADVVRAAFEKLKTGEVPQPTTADSHQLEQAPAEWTLDELVAGVESDVVEFKSSAFYSYKPDIPERVVTEAVVKTVAGFMNGGGGTLVIGVADDGEVLGIGPDLERKNLDEDRFVNSLTGILGSSLGHAASALANINVEEIESQAVALVRVSPSDDPVFAKVAKGDQVFFLRVNNTTRILEGNDLVSYVKRRFG